MTNAEALKIARAVFAALPAPESCREIHVIPLEISGGVLIRILPQQANPLTSTSSNAVFEFPRELLG